MYVIKNFLIVPVIGILFIFALVFIISDSPIESLYYFFIGPFRNIFTFGNMLNSAVPLIFGALAVTIAMKTGNLNLGGEGQIYLGAFTATIIALTLSSFGFFGSIIAIVIASLFSASVAAFSGFCKAKWNTNELITTFLLSCAIIPIINYLVTGPFLDPQTSLISTKKIAENMRLIYILKPSNLNASIFITVIFVFLTIYFLNRTKTGYEFRMAGFNELFARYGGINTKLNIVLAMAISGFLYGFAGGISVLGTYHATIKEFSAGMGWLSLTVALIARFSPAAIIPCAIFLAWIETGARIAMQNTGLTYEVAYIVQAVIFFLSTSLVIKNILSKRRKE